MTQPTEQVIISKVKYLFAQQITLDHKKFNLFPPAFVHEEESWVTGDTNEDYITGVEPEEVGFSVNDGSAVDFVVLKGATGLGVGLNVGRDTER